jgi:hypothetical protein
LSGGIGSLFSAFYICSVLLADEPPTSAETKLIRFLTEGRLPEAKALLQELAGMQLSIGIVEELILPTLRAIENDLYPGAGGGATKSRIYEQLRELIEEMTVEIPTDWSNHPNNRHLDSPESRSCLLWEKATKLWERYSALAGGRRDRYPFAFLANSSRRESGASEGIENQRGFCSRRSSQDRSTLWVKWPIRLSWRFPTPGFFWAFGACRRKALRAG